MKKNVEIDFSEIKPIKYPPVKYTFDNENFVRFPNYLIKTDTNETFGIHRVILTVYFLIDWNSCSFEDKSYLLISDVFEAHNLKMTRHKPTIFYEIIKCLVFLSQSNMIEIISDFDIDKLSYTTPIIMRIFRDNFDATKKFTKLTYREFNFIITNKHKANKENLLAIFLYVKSFIFTLSDEDDFGRKPPEAFFESIDNIKKTLGISKRTIDNCLDVLTSYNAITPPLLMKHDVGSIFDSKTQKPKNVPNIYVLNKAGYQHEINLTLENLKQKYKVEKFFKKSGNYN